MCNCSRNVELENEELRSLSNAPNVACPCCGGREDRLRRVPFRPAVKPNRDLKDALRDEDVAEEYAQILLDMRDLPKTTLHGKYKYEYNSFRGAKQRSRIRHMEFDARLGDFRDWLAHLGRRPMDGYTVDRINCRKGYVVGNLRWASKNTQTQNRFVTKWHPLADGRRVTTKMLASEVDLPYDTVYKRLRRGSSAQQILDSSGKDPVAAWRFPPNLARILEPLYRGRKVFATSRIDFAVDYVAKLIRQRRQSGQGAKGIESLEEMGDQLCEERSRLLRQKWEKELDIGEQLILAVKADLPPPVPAISCSAAQGLAFPPTS